MIDIQIQSVVVSNDQIEAIMTVKSSVKQISAYNIEREIEHKIIRHITEEWIKANAVEVMKKIDVNAVINMVTLKAAGIIKE